MKNFALIVDDDRSQRRIISGIIRSQFDLSPVEAENGAEALDILVKSANIKIVILDLEMPVMDGRKALVKIQHSYPHIPVIVLTGSNKTEDAANAIKNGATDFLAKPIEIERLTVCIRNGLKMSRMAGEISRLKRKSNGVMTFTDLIGHDAGLVQSVATGQKASASHLPVLITGETGTGKEMFARAIHGESDRAGYPFIAVNCGAIPEKLVESILFGHEKGAFTGAIEKSLGKFQEAGGGTIFLDEVGELPLDAQVKLLRVLQEKEVEPVGAGKSVKVDVRIISATNRDLAQEVQEGRFREDLYFRLNVLGIALPPLHTRADDIEALAQYFIESYAAGHQTTPKILSEEALHDLKQYEWPGNVRELENTIGRAMALSDGNDITRDDLVLMTNGKAQTPLSSANTITTVHENGQFKSFKALESEIVTQALAYHHNNMSQTARVLEIAKSTLYAKLDTAQNKKLS